MDVHQKEFKDYLSLSSSLTGFSRFQLQGTGQAELYFATVLDIVGEATFFELLRVFSTVEGKAAGDDAELAEGLRRELLSSDKFGPVTRNIIKLWYVGTWYQLPREWRTAFGVSENDVDFVVSPVSFTEGLLWPTLGVNPPGARGQGWGSWSDAPSLLSTRQAPVKRGVGHGR